LAEDEWEFWEIREGGGEAKRGRRGFESGFGLVVGVGAGEESVGAFVFLRMVDDY
jgi:hypothetical protein